MFIPRSCLTLMLSYCWHLNSVSTNRFLENQSRVDRCSLTFSVRDSSVQKRIVKNLFAKEKCSSWWCLTTVYIVSANRTIYLMTKRDAAFVIEVADILARLWLQTVSAIHSMDIISLCSKLQSCLLVCRLHVYHYK